MAAASRCSTSSPAAQTAAIFPRSICCRSAHRCLAPLPSAATSTTASSTESTPTAPASNCCTSSPAGVNDGDFPSSGLLLFGNRLRGATAYGGDLNRGTVYELNSDGTGYQLNYEFQGGANDGQSPQDNLVGSGTNLYGVTSDGGTNDSGTVFALSLVGVPGDYSGNGTVGNEDYNLWRTNFGSKTSLAADGNANKIVDAADYIIWRNNRTSGAAAAVPEPAALLLACAAFSFICRRHRS